MRKIALLLLAAAGVLLLVAFAGRLTPSSGNASSHREAPLISEDPGADNTDLYAFRSPDKPSTFTIISNWIPGEDPAAGPNWYTFSQSARYNIYVDTDGDTRPNLTYRFTFKTPTGPFFLGNTVQDWTATLNGKPFAKGKTPPNNIGPRLLGFLKVKDYAAAAKAAVAHAGDGTAIFAGQRDDGVLRRHRRDLRPARVPQGRDDREHGRREGLLLGLQRPRDRPADPDREGAREERRRRHLVDDRPHERHRQRPAAPRAGRRSPASATRWSTR